MRQRLLAGVTTVNDRGVVDQEARAAEGRQKMERRRMLADDRVAILRALQERGLRIFPVAANAKAPPIRDWQRLATADTALLGLWEDTPDSNAGVSGEGLLIVDADVKNGGPDSFATLDMTHGFPDTFTVGTPTGGFHAYYALPEGHPGVPNSAGTLARGLDIRSKGGYVVSPGSTVPAGTYKITRDLPIAPAPEWLVQRLGEASQAPKERNTAPVADAPDPVLERARQWLRTTASDAGGYALCCALRDRGVSERQAAELLASGEAPAGSWPEAEARLRAQNAFRYAQNAPGAAVALPSDFAVMEPAAVAALPTPVAPIRTALDDFHSTAGLGAGMARQGGAGDGGAATGRKSGPQRLAAFVAQASTDPGYVVKGMFQRRSYALIVGAPGSGKTFLSLDLAHAVASGREWMGKRVRQGAVLYLPFEGAGGMRGRAAALRQHYGTADVPLYFDDAGYNLRDAGGRQALGAAIAQLPTAPVMIVIDTLAHALCGGDENSAQDVSAFNAGVQALIQATGACVVVIHHPGKNAANGARGSSALLGAVDTEMAVADRKITPTKQRDVELGEPVGFQLKTISVGIDADGDIVTSCVVLPNAVAKTPAPTNLKQGSVQHLAYEVLKELRPNNDPVTDAEWKLACAEFLPARRSAWAEVRMRLKRARLIEQNSDGLWMRRME